MNVTATRPFPTTLAEQAIAPTPAPPANPGAPNDTPELRQAFQDFVGQSFFGQFMKEMRKTVGKTPYFHGGRGEEMFQQQLDQKLVEKVSESSAKTFSEPMYKLFLLGRAG